MRLFISSIRDLLPIESAPAKELKKEKKKNFEGTNLLSEKKI